MNAAETATQEKIWPGEGVNRIPAWIYSDEALFEREMEKFFAGDTWNFVGLEAEIPEPGSYQRTFIGLKPVLMTRDANGQVHVLENRCAHRGAPVCWKQRGKAKELTCPYHHWTYDLGGDLRSVAFMRGSPKPNPGMPADFDKKEHGMRKLRTLVRGGAIWASFSDNTRPFEDYVGPQVLEFVDRAFNGRPLRLLGYSRQIMPCNWKLYLENARDPYHATLLHAFFTSFGLFRADAHTRAIPSDDGRHNVAFSWFDGKASQKNVDLAGDIKSIVADLKLHDMETVTPKQEFADGRIGTLEVFPSMVLQQHVNTLAVRHIIPKSTTSTELSWIYFGYEDDDETMRRLRLKHGNLTGPAGYVSLDDSEVLKQMQPVVENYADSSQVVEMHGKDHVGVSETSVSESMIRAFYTFYRREMGL
ncbi:MAG: Rieske 2Fe-2S domain-containing protein [Betaproteobacteria bacterium]|jgi:anthranilate 1,2-dioxygenase large subunit